MHVGEKDIESYQKSSTSSIQATAAVARAAAMAAAGEAARTLACLLQAQTLALGFSQTVPVLVLGETYIDGSHEAESRKDTEAQRCVTTHLRTFLFYVQLLKKHKSHTGGGPPR